MPDNAPKSDPDNHDDAADDIDARIARAIDAKLNSAITGHMKRFRGDLEKSLSETITKALDARKPAEEKPATDTAAAKVDPELAKLRETVEKLTKASADAEAARIAAERKSLRETAVTRLKEELAAVGITGARARAVIADAESSGSLRVNEESGAYEFEVKRARTKGGRAEAVVHDDFASAVKDWAQTTDAAEFLPAPSAQQPAQRRGAPLRAPGGAAAQRGGKPDPLATLSEAEIFGD